VIAGRVLPESAAPEGQLTSGAAFCPKQIKKPSPGASTEFVHHVQRELSEVIESP